MKSELRKAYQKGIRWSATGSLGGAFFQFAQMAVFARLAGPEAAGDYALAATFISFLSPVAEAGLSQAVVQAERISAPQLATLAWVNVALGLLIFLLLWITGPVMADWFERPELPGLLCLMGASLLITPFGAQYSGLITREMQFGPGAIIEISAWAVSFVCTVYLAFSGWGAWSMAAGFFIRNVAATLGCILYGRKILRINLFNITPLREIKPMLRFGAFELSSRWADFFSNYFDKIIVAKWLGASALGYYNLAFTFLMLPTARLGFMLTRVGFPVFARIRHDPAQLQAFFERSARELILLLFPVYLVMALFSREIILLCFGEKWLPAIPIFVALGLAGFVRTLCAPFPQMIRGLGKPQIWLVWMLIFSAALCLSLVLFLALEPTALSAAWSRTLAKFTVEIFLLHSLARWCGLDLSPVLKFAGKLMLYLLPLLATALLLTQTIAPFWLAFSLKSIAFALGIHLIYTSKTFRESAMELLRNFFPTKNQL